MELITSFMTNLAVVSMAVYALLVGIYFYYYIPASIKLSRCKKGLELHVLPIDKKIYLNMAKILVCIIWLYTIDTATN